MYKKISPALLQTGLYALSIIFIKGMSFFMLPFLTHALTPEDFGKLEVLNSLAILGSIVVGFGLLNALYRFIGLAKSVTEKKRQVARIFGLTAYVGLIWLLISVLTAPLLATYLPGSLSVIDVTIIMTTLALEGCIAIPLGWLRMQEKALSFFWISSLKAAIQVILIIGFINYGMGITGVVLAALMAIVLQGMILVSMQVRSTGINLSLQGSSAILKYSLPLVLSGLIGFVLAGLDRWILADAVGTAELAEYAIAAKFALISALIFQPFGMWWQPKRFCIINEKDGVATAAKFAAMGSALVLIIALSIGLSAPIVIEYLLPASYLGAVAYVPWLVLLTALKESTDLLNLGLYYKARTHLIVIINALVSTIALVAMLWLTPELGVLGAIYALFVAQGMRLILSLYFSQKILPLPYPSKRLVLFALLTTGWLSIGSHATSVLNQMVLILSAVTVMTLLGLRLQLLPMPLSKSTKTT